MADLSDIASYVVRLPRGVTVGASEMLIACASVAPCWLARYTV